MKNRRAFSGMQWKEIKRKMRKASKLKDIKGYKRLLALHIRGLGKSNQEISEVIGFSNQYITELVSKYIKEGMDAILTDKRTSNNRRMSFAEEAEFLEQFVDLAEAGQLITVNGMLSKFEEVTGKKSNTSTIYKLLKRHGWRKIAPRPKHPNKATDEEIESSKKLTQNSERLCWRKIEEMPETSTSTTKV